MPGFQAKNNLWFAAGLAFLSTRHSISMLPFSLRGVLFQISCNVLSFQYFWRTGSIWGFDRWRWHGFSALALKINEVLCVSLVFGRYFLQTLRLVICLYTYFILHTHIYISYTHVYGVRMYHMTYLFETRECICLEVYPASSSSRQTWTHQSLVICVMLCTSVWMFARGPPVAILRDPGFPWPRSSQLRQYSLPPGGIAEQPLRSSTRGCQGGRSNDAKLHKGYAKITQSPCKARAKIVVP